MSAECHELTIQILNIHLEMRHALRSVQHHRYSTLVGLLDDFPDGVDGSENIAHMGYADKFGFVGQQPTVGLHIQYSLIGDGDDFQHDASAMGQYLPWDDVGMVLDIRHQHFVARFHESFDEA